MAWTILKVHPSPMQNSVVLYNDDLAATPTTDYHKADKLARKVLGVAQLNAKGYSLTDKATRTYISQNY